MDTMQFAVDRYDPRLVSRNETLFATANGYLGFRGDFEEKEGTFHKGTYINGFHDSEPIVYGETAYGYAENHETMLNLPDPKRIELRVGTGAFSLERGTVNAFRQSLDFRTGLMARTVDWTAEDGTRILVASRRLVSFVRKNCAAIEYTVTATDRETELTVASRIDLGAANRGATSDPRVGAKFSADPLTIVGTSVEENQLSFAARTRNTHLHLHGSAFHACSKVPLAIGGDKEALSLSYSFSLEPGDSVTLVKYIAYCTENEQDRFLVHRCASVGFEGLVAEQKAFLDRFWAMARLRIEGDEESEQALQFNLFHLLQSCPDSGTAGLAAKGLAGEGYEGHYFWDAEAYVLPVFSYLNPDLAEALLRFRHSMLPKARKRARTMGLDGALFPWRTISGEECSAYYPAGTAQYHIDADIVHAAKTFLAATGKPVPSWIVEMAIETARMWSSLGQFSARKGGRFCIDEVTGPDEYSACVDNNAYTNLMARENLRFASALARTCKPLPLPVSGEEVQRWERAAESMYVPFDPELGIYPQDDSFLQRADWPFDATPRDRYPLLLHYHPLVIYRHRVLKQPDLVLAQFFLSARFSRAERIRNFSFYEPYTTGDSSLSDCIQSIMACDAFQPLKAWSYFRQTVRMDIDDMNGNSADGIHTASMAGSWMAMVYGFAGFRDAEGRFSFAPCLPDAWNSLLFCLRIGRSVVKVKITHEEASYSLVDGEPLALGHRNTPFVLGEGETRKFSLVPVLRAVLFDLDGVIVDTASLHFRAWKTVAAEEGLSFDRATNKRLLGVSRKASLEIILEENGVDWEQERKDRVLERKNRIYVASLETLSPSDVFPGIRELLCSLRERSVKTALVSASRNARTVCSRLGIDGLFDLVTDVRKVQKPKPEPDLFLSAAEQLDVWYGDCLGIEDAKAGIAAIRKAGMKAVGIGSEDQLGDADCILPDTAALSFGLLSSVMAR
jgi:alpha,alpha-trehalose phosphorylase